MNASRAQNKLLKSGYLPQKQSDDFELWIDVKLGGTSISFFKSHESSETDVFRVYGTATDRPEFDDFNSYYTESLSEAIRVSRVSIKR